MEKLYIYHYVFSSIVFFCLLCGAVIQKQLHVVAPIRVDEKGYPMTPSVHPHQVKTHRRNSKVYYKINLQDKEYLLELHINNNLLSNSTSVDTLMPALKNRTITGIVSNKYPSSMCQLIGKVQGYPRSKVALSNCNGLMGFILLDEDLLYLIKPLESPCEHCDSGHPHNIYMHSSLLNCSLITGNTKVKRKQKQTSNQRVRSHKSRIMIKNRTHNDNINNNYVKINYINDKINYNSNKLNYNNDKINYTNRRRDYNNDIRNYKKSTRKYTSQMFIETLVVLDKSLIEYYKTIDLENYVHTVMNMANTALKDRSLGMPLELTIVRTIRLEQEDDEMNLAVSKDAVDVLEVFKAWANRINPVYDSHPYHHDIAVLITKFNICFTDDEDCGLLGLTSFASYCDPKNSAVVVRDNGLLLGYTIAHAIGHALGLQHDTIEETGCKPVENADGSSTFMAKHIDMRMNGWSNCSREYLLAWIDTGQAYCLYDKPSKTSRQVPSNILPGVLYGVDQQCRSLLGYHASKCADAAVECLNMKCYLSKYGCIETYVPLADGTACGKRSWCFRGKCISKGVRPADAIHGQWSDWQEWSPCTRTCGGGVTESTRSCDEPRPYNGGNYCVGKRVRYKICNSQPCLHAETTYRDVQCAEYNKWIFPETNKTHVWKSSGANSVKPCELMCVNEEGQQGILKTQAEDGTECNSAENSICIDGVCKRIPCDKVIDSEAVEDACGVCHGDGTMCTLVTEEKRFRKMKYLQSVCLVPDDALNVVAELTSPTKSTFVVMQNRKKIINRRKSIGFTKVNNTTVWLGLSRPEQQILKIKGPVVKDLRILVAARDEVTVRYTISRPRNLQPSTKTWQFVDWTDCSGPCGPGTQISEAKCIDSLTGVVENQYCPLKKKPALQQRICEILPCQHRWQISEWSGCDCKHSPEDDEERAVDCVCVGGVDTIVEDHKCMPPKPESRRRCNCLISVDLPQKGTIYPTHSLLNIVELQYKKKKHNKYNVLHRSHEENIQDIREKRGTLVKDYENINTMDLALEVDDEVRKRAVSDFSKPNQGENFIHLRGKKAVALLNKIQKE